MKRTLLTAAAALAALASCATPAHAAGENVIYSFCSDTQDIASLNWFDADNEQQMRSAIRLTSREAGRWCATARFASRSTHQLTASSIQTEGTYAACAISVNNKTTATDYATGRYAVAVCAA